MEQSKKEGRYERITIQLKELTRKSPTRIACMATISAVLHYKFDHYFWTGFYLLERGALTVGPYQGPVACQDLERGKGVCWAAINKGETIVVPDVHMFPGHIACDSRSNSEIVIPLFDKQCSIYGVLDIDSKDLAAFDETDKYWLEQIVKLIKQDLK
jgi:L-methionine (R)-S-oxide reductase